MPRSLVPVAVPVRFADASTPEEVHLEVVAGTGDEAAEIGRLIVERWLAARDPERPALAGSARAGTPLRAIAGPHAYVLGREAVTVLEFPPRFDSDNGERLGEALAALAPEAVLGLILDCDALTYINTVGLTGIAAHLKRLSIHLVAVPTGIARVFDIVGMTRFLDIHETLEQALAAIRPRA